MPLTGSRTLAAAVLAAGVGVGGYFLAGWWRAADRDREAAAAALDRRDFAAAGRHLDAYLADHPADLPARLEAAQAARRRDDFAAAAAHLRAFEAGGGSRDAAAREARLTRAQRGDLGEVERLLAGGADDLVALEAAARGCLATLDPNASYDPARPPPPLAPLDRAVGRWERAARTRADRAQGLVWKGRARFAAADHPAAVAAYRAALELDPDHPEAHTALALAVAQTDPADATAHLEAVLRRDPADRAARFTLGVVRRGAGDLDGAARELDAVLAAAPDDLPALLERGMVALDAGRPAEAAPLLARAEARGPNQPAVHLALARLYQLQDRPADAARARARYLQLRAAP